MLSIVAATAATAPPATAATVHRVIPATISSSFEVRATDGYWVTVTALRRGGGPVKVSVDAAEERGKAGETSVEYTVDGRLTKDGGIKAKLRGLGRIDVGFEQRSAEKSVFTGPACTNPVGLVRKGTYRGTIVFRGEGGYTKTRHGSAEGKIREARRHVCTEEARAGMTGTEGTPDNLSLYAVGRNGTGKTSFTAVGPPASLPSVTSSGLPTVMFVGEYLTERRGIQIYAYIVRDTGSQYFLVPRTSGGVPPEATVRPPAPFSGEATFRLDTPTSASWTGDMALAVPGIGEVPLAGPGTWANICEGTTCSETLPPEVRGGFLTGS